MGSRVRRELIDDLMQAYVDWRTECLALHVGYGRWSGGTAADERGLAFAAYRAALDREELACVVLRVAER
ncbi:MAG: hypothetical protein WA696_02970 [Solirubrobacterales bacterium]